MGISAHAKQASIGANRSSRCA